MDMYVTKNVEQEPPIRTELQNKEEQESFRQIETQNTKHHRPQHHKTNTNAGKQNKFIVNEENHDWKKLDYHPLRNNTRKKWK